MIGKMDKRVSFYRVINTADDNIGGRTVEDQLYATRWANVVEKHINRIYSVNSFQHNLQIDITIRKDSGIKRNMKAEYDSIKYVIDNFYSDEKFTYIRCYGEF